MKTNIHYKHARFYKIALIAGLVFVAIILSACEHCFDSDFPVLGRDIKNFKTRQLIESTTEYDKYLVASGLVMRDGAALLRYHQR